MSLQDAMLEQADMRNLRDLQAPAGRIDLCTKQGRNGLAIEKGRPGSQIY